jgi:hypothetical protein
MKVTTNLQPPIGDGKNPQLPEGAILYVSTTDPKDTQFIDCEVWDANHNPITFGDTDPEFGMSDSVRLALRRYTRSVAGVGCTLVVNWADSSDEEYSDTITFDITPSAITESFNES